MAVTGLAGLRLLMFPGGSSPLGSIWILTGFRAGGLPLLVVLLLLCLTPDWSLPLDLFSRMARLTPMVGGLAVASMCQLLTIDLA